MKAVWNGVTLADSADTVVVEGNHYFPISAVNREYIRDSAHESFCGWKGTASYYDVLVRGQVNESAAWYYAEPMAAAENIRGRVAFWKGVEIRPD